jgi:hypothetical protein
MNYIDPNNPNSGRIIPGAQTTYDFYSGSPYEGAVLVPGPGIAQRFRLPDGRIVSSAEINAYRRANVKDRGPELFAALNRLAELNTTGKMVGQLPTSPTRNIDTSYSYRGPAIVQAPSTSKSVVPYGGTGMAPVAKVISSLGRSVAAPFSTAFSGKKINVGTGGVPMVNVFRSMFGK